MVDSELEVNQDQPPPNPRLEKAGEVFIFFIKSGTKFAIILFNTNSIYA